MTGAMYAAVAGLKTHMTALNVIGNNISNVNTLGYKAARYTFNEALYTTSRSGSNGTATMGGRNPAQIGYGCSIGTIDLDMSTKTFSPTGIQLDCMIDGDGFFLVGDKTGTGITTKNQLQSMTLSRWGAFEVKDGYLVDGNGNVVYGFLRTLNPGTGDNAAKNPVTDPDNQCSIAPILTAIRIPMARSVPKYKTDEQGNEIKDEAGNPIPDGQKYELYYPKVKTPTAGGTGDTNTPQYSTVETSIPPLHIDGAADEIPEDQGTMDQVDEDDTVGWPVLSNLAIDETGRLTGMTQDKQQVVVGYVAIAQVDSPNGVTHIDGQYYQALGGAGDVHVGTVGGAVQFTPPAAGADGTTTNSPYSTDIPVSGAGDTKLVNGGLESSGTDLATEISNMITIQRGYQANTRIVTVTDSMLEELVNMKR